MVTVNVKWRQTRIWWSMMVMMVAVVVEVATLNGANVCMVQQKYNITKRVKYRAPMSVRTYEWCFAMPPRCSKWKTEMRELTKLETDERIAEVAVCCPGYKMKDVSCVPICPNGKTGHHCSEDCPPKKWGPNCVNDCKTCGEYGTCSPITGECSCQEGWQGESCESRVTTATSTEAILTLATKTTTTLLSTTALLQTTAMPATTTQIYISNTPEIDRITTTPKPLTPTVAVIPMSSESTSKMTTSSVLTTESTSTTPVFTTQRVIVPSSTETLPTKKPTAAPRTTAPTSTVKKNDLTVETTTTAVMTTAINLPITTTTVKATVETKTVEPTTKNITSASIYNRTEAPYERQTAKDIFVEIKTIPISKIRVATTESTPHKTTYANITNTPIATTFLTTTEGTKEVITKRPDATIRYFPTTVKFKPKEIWIRPAQKGETIESKINKDIRHKATNYAPNTTPKTIIVSIIPTSVSYTTFKKVALTTVSTFSKANASIQNHNATEITRPMFVTASPTTKGQKTSSRTNKSTNPEPHIHKVTKPTFQSKELSRTIKGTNSMITVNEDLISNFTSTVPPTNTITRNVTKSTQVTKSIERVTKHPIIKIVTVKPRNVTIITISGKNNDTIKITKTVANDIEKTNATKIINKNDNSKLNHRNNVTESPEDEEFHILTEPEHITAVMEGKGKEMTSVDLISVISIAGGIMMAVITVAVIIVMIERCRRPRYEDVGKMNDIHMQVMIDNNDVPPPPYIRSIFHTPLPDPPTSEKCHYQPISTLDRNLKQFMRPVVVQTISPLMLENFRGILECHYDHLPRRSYNYEANQKHCSVAPSLDDANELTCLRPCSIAESTIEALKCEANLDVIDNTTSEPLYAEIPCWRPPSEHAIEVINMNGEAVTEL